MDTLEETAFAALYRCPECGTIAPWAEGYIPDDDRRPLMFCVCGAEFDPRPHRIEEGATEGERPPVVPEPEAVCCG